ncbi:hypothetical protein QBC41DRAFT_368105 [Cercophora samala]|uniref:Uncharacterized protein n=1 Tax=Cercophora samala TaxID=330535 RepID=A0AA39Z3I3_9PEZI|nr:hypothetical protein QBC41DRAFT_368105 [Cercophora samala]
MSSPIAGFIPLSPTIHLYQPLSPFPTSTNQNPPQLIILCTWTSAKPAHIAKYTAAYQTLYPPTPILLITTHITDLIFHSTPHKIKSLLPAVQFLLSSPPAPRGPYYFSPFHQPTPCFPPGSILLHTFSEGGSFAAVSLAHAYEQHSKQKLPVGAFVFDSTPGSPNPSLASSTAALGRTLPGWFCRHRMIQKSVGGVVYYLTFRARSSPSKDSSNKNRKFVHWLPFTQSGLANDRLWDLGEHIPTTYLFSEKDDLVLWEDVQSHAVQAGRRSLMVRFKETGHCGHVRGRRERGIYWGAVRMTWEGVRVDGGLGVRLRGLGENGKGWVSLDSLCLEEERGEGGV